MQRPVMNPMYFEESSPASEPRKLLHRIGQACWRVLRYGFRLLTFDPFARIAGFRVEEGTAMSRAMRGIFYRLAFVPVFIAAIACAIVWVSTHPRSVTSEIDPTAEGIYYDAVSFGSTQNTRIDGWLVPVIDAKTVIEQQDKVLRKKHPAVVLLHSMGQRREQVLPLIKPLHEAGYVVLAINLRGGGPRATVGETFGLNEAEDVKAAVELLRRRPFVDPKKVALVGFGTGATAALLAADADAQIAAVVADHPVRDSGQLIESRLVPQHFALRWLEPLCKWTFEMSYGVDAEDVDLTNFKKLFESRPVLMIDHSGELPDPGNPRTLDQVRSFLTKNLQADSDLASAK